MISSQFFFFFIRNRSHHLIKAKHIYKKKYFEDVDLISLIELSNLFQL